MRPAVVSSVVVTLLLAGCGGSGSSSGSSAESRKTPTSVVTNEPSSSPAEQTFFVKSDTDAINSRLSKAVQLGTNAVDRKRIETCNKAGDRGYPAWRKCWHGLLDPLGTAVSAVATQFATMSAQGFPRGCVRAIQKVEAAFKSFRTKVVELAAGFDSDDVQVRAGVANRYTKVLHSMSGDFGKHLPALTQACYSPQDLASLSAAPSASPTS